MGTESQVGRNLRARFARLVAAVFGVLPSGANVFADTFDAVDRQVLPETVDDSRGELLGPSGAPSIGDPRAANELRVIAPWRAEPMRHVRVRPGMTMAADAEVVPVGEADERLAYSNTLGAFRLELPANEIVSDDLTLTAGDGCLLRKYRFQVAGKAGPRSCGPEGTPCGPFTLDYQLFDACPGAGGLPIPGTAGTFVSADREGDYEIEVVVPPEVEVALPPRVWLGVKFDRAGAGVIGGALPLVGFSGDVLDFLSAPCNSSLGGFPRNPYASFFAEVYVNAECPPAFPGYENIRAANSGLNYGATVCLADDIKLSTPSCDMVAMEIGVRDKGLYDVEIRRSANAEPLGGCPTGTYEDFNRYNVPGTWKRFLVSQNGPAIRRFTFDPPVALPAATIYAVMAMNNSHAQWILTRRNASLGDTGTYYYVYDAYSGGWDYRRPIDNGHGGMHFAITCAGEAPVGACCDQYIRDEQGEAVCRDVPRMNCAFPPRGSTLRPDWVDGATCGDDPFPYPCGVAACCEPDDTCENLTKNECDAVEPVGRPHVWNLGQYCGEDGQRCPPNACLRGEGTCMTPRHGVGCYDPFCCSDVCRIDPWCCGVEWDRDCVRTASLECDWRHAFDECHVDWASVMSVGARSSTFFANTNATHNANDPLVSCRSGFAYVCNGGSHDQQGCEAGEDCPDGTCVVAALGSGSAERTVWFKFEATHTTAEISLCDSEDDVDTMLQVFSASDPTSDQTACASLMPVACNDDGGGCAFGSRHAYLCVDGLVPGEPYYIMVGGKTVEDAGVLRLNIQSPCPPPVSIIANDRCDKYLSATLGVTRFELDGATPSISDPPEGALRGSDIWYLIEPTENQRMVIDTCGPNVDGYADAGIELYVGWGCRWESSEPFMQASAHADECARGARMEFDAWAVNQEGAGGIRRFMIRLVDESGLGGVGDLRIERVGDIRCWPWFDWYVGHGPFTMSGVVDARRPHHPDDGSRLEGLDDIWVTPAGFDVDPRCLSFEESSFNPALHPDYGSEDFDNEIIATAEGPDGGFRVLLKRPITPGELTRITYHDALGREQHLCMFALPGDVDASGTVGGADILALIDALSAPTSWGGFRAEWGAYSYDINHDGAGGALDILELIDLLNGAGAFKIWYGASIPLDALECQVPE